MLTPSRSLAVLGFASLFALSVPAFAETSAAPQPIPAADPKTKSDRQDAADDETVVLSPFTIQSEKNNGYVASESVTGTRVASKIRDLPFQVNVITSQFMADFGAFDMSQQLGWVSNISPSDSEDSLVLRGFQTTPFVDGFRRLGKLDIVDTDRVEIIKGPAASIYGQTLPGGVVNYVSKRPETKGGNELDVTAGSDRFFRASLSSTGPVGNSQKLFYRASVSTNSRNFEQQFASKRSKFGSAMFLYKIDADTSFSVKVNAQDTHNRDRNAVPWIKSSTKGFVTLSDGVTPLQYTYVTKNPLTGATSTKTANVPLPQVIVKYANNPDDVAKINEYIANPTAYGTNGSLLPLSGTLSTTNSWDRLGTELADYRSDGTQGYTASRLYGLNLVGEHRTAEWLSHRFTFDLFQRTNDKQSVSGNQAYYNDPNYLDGELGTSTPTWRITPQRGYSSQLDNLFTFKTGPIAHKFLVTFDFAHQEKRDKSVKAVTGTGYNDLYLVTDPVTGIQYPFVIPLGPRSTGTVRYTSGTGTATYSTGVQELAGPLNDTNYYYPTYADHPEIYTSPSLDNWQASDDYGLFVSERATFLKGRIIALVGGRYDYMVDLAKNYLGTDKKSLRSLWDDQALTYQSGITGYLTKNIVLFANKSTAYSPTTQVVPVKQVTVLTTDASGATTSSTTSYSSKILPNESGRGYEFGVRFNLFNERFNVGLSRFVIDRYNKVDSFVDEFGINEYVGSGNQRSKGYEFDFNWAVTDSLQFLGGYGYNDARYTASTLPYLVGTGTPQNSKTNVSLAVRYQFKNSILKGLSLTAGVRQYSKSLVNVGSGGTVTTNPYSSSWRAVIYNTPMSNGVLPFTDLPANLAILSANNSIAKGGNEPTGAPDPQIPGSVLKNLNQNKGYTSLNIPASWVLYTPSTEMASGTQYYIIDGDGSTAASYSRSAQIDDNRANVFNAPYTLWTFGVSYSFKMPNNITHTIRLNLDNAFDKFYTYGNGVLGFGREYKLSYSLSF
jgi:outer membrane receptor protein involved in Fe transport